MIHIIPPAPEPMRFNSIQEAMAFIKWDVYAEEYKKRHPTTIEFIRNGCR